MKKKFIFLAAGLFPVIFACCDLPTSEYYGTTDVVVNNSVHYDLLNEYFENFSVNSKKIYTFQTNDRSFVSDRGSTFWNIVNKTSGFEPFEVAVQKFSGKPYGGYGIVFNADIETVNMFCILINVERQICFGKINNGIFEFVKPWSNTDLLYPGWYSQNKVKIVKETSEYKVYINDTLYNSISVDNRIASEGAVGLCAVITNEEKFPEEPVKIVWEY